METNWRPGTVPAPEAVYVQVDIEPGEIGRSVPATLGIVADIRTVLTQLLEETQARGVASLASTSCDHERARDIRAELGGDRA